MFKAKLLKNAKPTDDLLQKRYQASNEEITLAKDVNDDDYLEWIVKSLKKKQIRLPEDGDKLREQLNWFSKMKNSPRFKAEYSSDINSYTPATLYEVFSSEEVGTLKSQNQKDKETITQGSKIIYDKAGIVCYEVYKQDALCLLSSNTAWCTAQPQYAERYLKEGPNYVVYKDGKPYCQWDPDSGQLMDTKDKDMRASGEYSFLTADPIVIALSRETEAFSEFTPLTRQDLQEALRVNYSEDLVALAQLMKKRWPAAEAKILSNISEDDDDNFWPVIDYASDVIKGRWPEAESRILKDVNIMRDPWVLIDYARSVIKGPWPEAELLLQTDPRAWATYQANIKIPLNLPNP
jgi:hypothetical protein